MSIWFLIYKSIVLSFVVMEIHSQEYKDKLTKSSLLKRFICFRIIQNLELTPPYMNPVTSEKLQLALDFLSKYFFVSLSLSLS